MASLFPGLTVLTADALSADQDLCAAIVGQDYAYLLKLKKTRKRSLLTSRISSRRRPSHPTQR